MPERKLVVQIVGDSSSLERTFAKSSKAAQQFGNQSTKGLGKAEGALAGLQKAAASPLVPISAGALGTAVVVDQLKGAIEAGSNLNEQISKSRQVFGDSSRDIEKWAETTASSIGIANDQALEATGTFGNLLTTVGLGPAKAATMSRALVQLAADLASFNNASPEDTLDAIRSGLIGEAEPLRRYGVLLSETRVQQQAMADTGKRNARQLTDQEKALARYEIILRDTTKAQGDFNRTSGGQANQTRILKAQIRDLQARLGRGLVPATTDATKKTNQLLIVTGKLADGLEKVAGIRVPGVGRLGDELKQTVAEGNPVIGFLGKLNDGLNRLAHQKPEVQVKVRGEDDIVKALNDVDAFRNAVAGGIPVNIFVQVKGLKEATSEIESLRSTTIQTLGDTFKPPPGAGGKSPEDIAKQRNQWFDAAIGREVSRAQAISNLSAQNAALTKIAAEIQVRIKNTKDITRRLKLEDDLFAVQQTIADNRTRIADNVKDAAAKSKQKSRDAWDEVMDSLGVQLDDAEITKSFRNDLAVLKKIERQILARIKVEGRTAELVGLLHRNRQQQAAKLEQQRQAARDALKARQFRALGLTAEGEEAVPQVPNLQKRAAQLKQRLAAAGKLTPAILATFNKIAAAIKLGGKKTSREVRAAIDAMLDEIADGLKGTKRGPITKGMAPNIDKMIEDLGLSPEQARLLKARLARIGPGGTVAPGGTGAFGKPVSGMGGRPFGSGTGPVATAGGIIITGPVTVISDDPDTFHKQLQRKARRRGTQTTGPHAGNAMGTTR